jgi:eukaryotic-like serine/threonine-protein kinase
VLALAAAAWGWWRPMPAPPALVVDLALDAAERLLGGDVAISPDGSMIAYAGRAGAGQQPALYLRRLDGDPDFRMVAGTEGGSAPDFSPDNRWIVFRRNVDRMLLRVSAAGGSVSTILAATNATWTHWGTDDRIVYWAPGGNYIVAASGGEPRFLKGLGGRRPFLLPDGSGVLGSTSQGVAIYDLRSDSVSLLVPGGTNPVYAASGHLLYVGEGGGLFAVAFDPGTRRVTGRPARVLDRVASHPNSRGYAVSRTGTLVQYDAAEGGPRAAGNRLVIHDFAGGADTLRLPRGSRWLPRFSPDGRFVTYTGETPGGDRTELFTFDRETRTETQITFNEDVGWHTWSPDGRRLAYAATIPDSGEAIYIRASDNSGEAVELVRSDGWLAPSGWPREDLLLFSGPLDGRGNTNLYTIAPVAGATPQVYLATPQPELYLALSPDQQFAVFAAGEYGRLDVWVREFPTPRGTWKVSTGNGTAPRWSPDGRFIYYWKRGSPGDTLMRARVDRTPSVTVHASERIAVREGVIGIGDWDLHPDGQRFIVAENVGASEAAGAPGVPRARHLLHLNWFTTLRAAVTRADR